MVYFDPAELAGWCDGRWHGLTPDRIAGFCNDSRIIQPGQLYVALHGERLDGHAFIKDARRRSACGALIDEAHATAAAGDWPVLIVSDTRRALMDLARGHRQRCRGEFVGITGSVGKTSVKEMGADLLAHIGRVTRTKGNWNNDIGLPLSLLRMDPGDRFGVFEVGMNHPGELAPLCNLLSPTWAVMTPIGPVHLEFFDSVAAIAEEKAALLAALPVTGTAILSTDDPWYESLIRHVRSRVIRLSMLDEQADYYGQWRRPGHRILTVQERASGEEHAYLMPLPGQYVADNALRAIALGREHGLSPDVIAHALAHYQPLSMRWNRVTIAGVHFVNDAYNANPMSMRAALDAFQEADAEGRRWLVLAGMFELGAVAQDEHEALGRYLAQFPWAGVLTVGSLGRWIADGAAEAGLTETSRLEICGDISEAAQYLKHHLRPGDAVLLKGSRGEHLENLLKEFENLMAPENGVLL
jgi:UDP-N-acetylmuramoyl-tripeptide--D-alanyl-D-alanine ligase